MSNQIYPVWLCPSCKRPSLPDGRQSCNCSVEQQEAAAVKRKTK